MAYLLRFLPFLLVSSVGCQNTVEQASDSEEVSRYLNVTATHLPANALGGLSMDAGVADMDGDGNLDIVIANEFRPNILLLNDGQGSFLLASDRLPRTERDSEDVGLADFDGDGDLDIVIVSEDDQVNEMYLQENDGSFSDASERIPVAGTSNALIVQDVNGDGQPDLLIGNNGQNRILINTGDQFVDETSQRLPTREDVTQDLELGDVDSDGDVDLLVGNEDANRLLLNDGSGVFMDAPTEALPLRQEPEETREADFGDVDGDGDLDILFANVRAFVSSASPKNRLLINDGSGQFQDETRDALPGYEDNSFDGDFFDLDGDGDLDIITSNSNGPSFRELSPYRVFLNDGKGIFTDAPSGFLPKGIAGSGFDTEQADFNGDGKPDLFLASRGTPDQLMLQK